MRARRWPRRLDATRAPAARAAAVVALGLALALAPARAQDEPPPDEGGPDAAPRAGERLTLPIDEEAPAAFKRVDDLAGRGQWDRVVKALDGLVESGGAVVLPGDGALVTVRAEARRRLLALPAEGRAAWALAHEDAARGLLEGAAGRADPGPLEALLAQHPASPLAGRARRLLVARALERADAAAALRHADALLASTDLDPAERPRLQLARAAALALLGRRGEADDALAAAGGGPEVEARRAALAGLAAPPPALPADAAQLAWTRETFGYYEVEAGGTAAWSEPAADGARVYVHDGSHALAVDLATGKVAWRTALRPEDAFQRPAGACRLALGPSVVACARPPADLGGGDLVGLARDDGRVLWRRRPVELRAAARVELPATVEGLAAAGDVVVALLVVAHEQAREVHAVALDARTGAPRWGAFLAGRAGGRPPRPQVVVADGAAVVATGLGAAAALEVDTGELRWLRRYPSQRDPENRPRRRGGIPGLPNVGVDGEEVDAGPEERPGSLVPVRGLVWAAPADARPVWAWDARTGEARATHVEPAVDALLGVADLEGGPAVVARTADGDLALATRERLRPVLQLGGALAGRACVLGPRAWLLRDDGLLEADLAAGRARRVGPAPAGANRANLVAAAGRVVLAAPRGLWATGAAAAPAPALPDGPDAIAAVVSTLADPRWGAREAASQRLVAAGEPARGPLAAAAAAVDPELRLRALFAAAELDRRDRLVRWRPLVQAEWEAAVPDLLNRLTHCNAEVRLEALRGLGELRTDAVAALLRELLADGDRRVAFAAATALLAVADRSGLPLLAEAVREGLPSDRLAALEALVAHGTPRDADLVRPGLRAAEPEVRAAAGVALVTLAGEAALPDVEPLLRDPEETVRLTVVERLAAAPPPVSGGVVAVLAAAVGDAAAAVRQAAVNRLAKDDVGGPVALAALGRALGDELPDTARTAARKLDRVVRRAEVLSGIPLEALDRASRSKDEQVRYRTAQIAIVYVARDGFVSVEALTRFLRDELPQVRGLRVDVRSKNLFNLGWGDFLLERAKATPFTAADVAAVGSLLVHAEADVRIKGYHTLSRAVLAPPGVGRLVAGGLDDAHPQIRAACRDWLVGADGAVPGLLDAGAVVEVLRVAVTSPREAGRAEAEAVLAKAPPPRLAEGYLRALRPGGEAAALPALRAAAGARLAALTEVPFDPAADPRAAFGAQALALWRAAHPGRTLEAAAAELRDDNPTTRWRAAQELAGLPVPQARNALAVSLDDPLEWVLKAKLEALMAVTGETFGDPRATDAAALRARAQRARLWVAERVRVEALPPGVSR